MNGGRVTSKEVLIKQRDALQKELNSLLLLADDLEDTHSCNVDGVLEIFDINPSKIDSFIYKDIIKAIKKTKNQIKLALSSDNILRQSNEHDGGFNISSDIEQYRAFIFQIKNVASVVIAQSLKVNLMELIINCKRLKANYLSLKPDESTPYNIFGWLPSRIPSNVRVNSIQEIQRVVNIVEFFIVSDGNINLSLIVDNPLKLNIKFEISQYENLIHQINGAILTEMSMIYSFNSVLYGLLKDLVTVPEKEHQKAKHAYNLLLSCSQETADIEDNVNRLVF